jgi:hypothetical protein
MSNAAATANFANFTFSALDAREQACIQNGWESEHRAVCEELRLRRDSRVALQERFEDFDADGVGIAAVAARAVARVFEGRAYVRRETRTATRHKSFKDGARVRGFAIYNAKTGAEVAFIAKVALKTPSTHTQAHVTFCLGEPDFSQQKALRRKTAVWRKLAI